MLYNSYNIYTYQLVYRSKVLFEHVSNTEHGSSMDQSWLNHGSKHLKHCSNMSQTESMAQSRLKHPKRCSNKAWLKR